MRAPSSVRFVWLLVVVLPCSLALGSCIRMNEPNQFSCKTDAECDDGERCRDAHHCVSERCATAFDCSSQEACVDGRCTFSQCGVNDFQRCAGNFGCDMANRVCRTTCTETEPCAAPAVCSGGRCMTSCTTSDQCGGFQCTRRLCATSCDEDGECARGFRCSKKHKCVAAEAGAERALCGADADCDSGHCCLSDDPSAGALCSEHDCERVALGESCTLALQCVSLRCEAGRCVDSLGGTGALGDPCRRLVDCQDDLTCSGAVEGGRLGSCTTLCADNASCADRSATSVCVSDSGDDADGACKLPCIASCARKDAVCVIARDTEGNEVRVCVPR